MPCTVDRRPGLRPRGSFVLDETRVSVAPSDVLVDTTVNLVYTSKTTEPTENCTFMFPFSVNDHHFHIYKVTAEVQTGDDNQTYRTEVKDDADAQNEANSCPDRADLCFPVKNEEMYQCTLGRLPGGATVRITLGYVTEWELEHSGKMNYTFLDLLEGPGCEQVSTFTDISTHRSVTFEAADRQTIEKGKGQNNTSTDFTVPGVDTTNGLLRLRYEMAPGDPEDAPGAGKLAVLVHAPRQQQQQQQQTNKFEVIFVIDRSGSMRGERIEHAKETLLLFLKSLPVGCYFNIIGFGHRHKLLFPSGPVEYNATSLQQAIVHHASIKSDMGGTYLLPPLQAVFNNKPRSGFTRNIFVLTDGITSGTDEIIKLVTEHKDSTRVFAFGIGAHLSADFIRDLAVASNGLSEFTSTNDRDMERKIMKIVQIAMTSPYKLTWKLDLPKGVTAADCELPNTLCPGQRSLVFLDVSIQNKEKYNKTNRLSVTMVMGEGGDQTKNVMSETFSTRDGIGLAGGSIYHLCSGIKGRTLAKEGAGSRACSDVTTQHNVALPSVSVLTYCKDETSTEHLVGHSVNKPNFPSAFGLLSPTKLNNVPGLGFRSPIRRRHRPVGRGNIASCLTKNAMLRIAKRGGVSRISHLMHDDLRTIFKEFLRSILKDATTYADDCSRKTVQKDDIDKALKNNGIVMYEIEDPAPARYEATNGVHRGKRHVMRSTPFGRPGDITSRVSSLLSVTHKTMSASSGTSRLSKQGSDSAQRDTRAGTGSLCRQPTIRVDEVHDASPAAGSTTTLKRRRTVTNLSGSEQAVSHTALSTPQDATPTGSLKTGRKRKSECGTPVPAKLVSKPTIQTSRVGKGNVTGRGKGKAPSRPKPIQTTISRTRSMVTGSGINGLPDFKAMINLITMQQFDGHWSLSADLAKLLRQTLTELTASPIKDHEVWATALSITWLEQTYPDQRTEWEMIHFKGMTFMQLGRLEGHTVPDLQKKAAAMLHG